MPYFPMFIDIKDQQVLIVGGGPVALRKIRKLAPYGARINVTAPKVLPEITAANVNVQYREFQPEDLKIRPVFVIAATDDPDMNREIAGLCRVKNIPVNVVDDPDACSFLFPALVQQGAFSAGISTGGTSPTASAYYKEQLRELLPANLDGILEWLEAQRSRVKEEIPEQTRRAEIFRDLFHGCIQKGRPLTEYEVQRYKEGHQKKGSVALVGAGCGKADLITVRGLRLLQQCQAVVYDDLIDPALLDAVPESARRIYMGKRSGAHSASQQEIHAKLVELAGEGLNVVRLKGGDPYLFGRGGEEILALKEAGIPFQEVPGIPSAIGIPAEAGIPVTHRGLSRGLHIVTAHTSDTEDKLPEDFDRLAKLSGTLVFLMGLQQLPKITARLMAAGKSGETPAAVISGGNSAHPSSVRAPLAQLEQAVRDANVVSPVIILVGEVAALDLSGEESPLKGIKVGITGTAAVAEKQKDILEKLGADTFRTAPSAIKERKILFRPEHLPEKSAWLVFTSANGVNTFCRHLQRQGSDPLIIQQQKIAVIGSATGAALETYGISYDLCPKVFTSKGLAEALTEAAQKEENIYLLRSSIGSLVLPEILGNAGYTVEDIAVYDLDEEEDSGTEVLLDMDYLTFSSAGGVERFFGKYGEIPQNIRCVCIGEVTAAALTKYIERPFLTAEEISVQGIVQAILKDQINVGI